MVAILSLGLSSYNQELNKFSILKSVQFYSCTLFYYMISLLTPTRNRPKQFALLTQYLSQQTLQGFQWIVVCDDDTGYNKPPNAVWIERKHTEGQVSLCQNLLTGLPHCTGDQLFIIEDDEIYFPRYLETMSEWLKSHDLVGEGEAHYYNLAHREYRVHVNKEHASLCQTAMKACVIPFFVSIIESCQARNDPFLDMDLWGDYRGSKKVYPYENLVLSPKGWTGGEWGEPGLGSGHKPNSGRFDIEKKVFYKWFGDYARHYE